MEDENNGNVHGRFSMSSRDKGMNYGLVEVVKCSTLRGVESPGEKGEE